MLTPTVSGCLCSMFLATVIPGACRGNGGSGLCSGGILDGMCLSYEVGGMCPGNILSGSCLGCML